MASVVRAGGGKGQGIQCKTAAVFLRKRDVFWSPEAVGSNPNSGEGILIL